MSDDLDPHPGPHRSVAAMPSAQIPEESADWASAEWEEGLVDRSPAGDAGPRRGEEPQAEPPMHPPVEEGWTPDAVFVDEQPVDDHEYPGGEPGFAGHPLAEPDHPLGEPGYLGYEAGAFDQRDQSYDPALVAPALRTGPAEVPIRYEHHVPAVHEPGYSPFALERLEVRRKSVPAKLGWRGAVNSLTKANIAPGSDELYELGLKERIQRMVRTTFPIAVVSVKGGVGKTVVTEALGSTFAAVRGDRVIAVDFDPDAGNLIARHGRETSLSISDLCADRSLTRYLDVRAHTSQNKATRLEVLTGPDYARTPMPLHRDEVDAILPILREHYSLVLMDTGSGLKTNLMTSILANSRALVLVSGASIDALAETQVTLEWLRVSGYQQLLDSAVLLINHTQRGRPKVNVGKAVEQFSRQIRPERIFVMPYDDHIAEGQEITLELMSAVSRRRYLEVAAAMSDLFPKVAGG